VTVRDDGPGEEVEAGKSHQFGLRSLRERLRAAFGSEAALTLHRGPEGFEARLELPARCELHDAKSSAKVQAL
jgi:signal transduction histidine kinase